MRRPETEFKTPHQPFGTGLRVLEGFGRRLSRCFGCRLLGRRSAIAMAAAASAFRRTFAAAARRRRYSCARAGTLPEPSVSVWASIAAIPPSADCTRKSAAVRHFPLPHKTNRAMRRSASRSPVGPLSRRAFHPAFSSFLPAAVIL